MENSIPNMMNELCQQLNYTDSPSFLRFDDAKNGEIDINFIHLYERAREKCDLLGVYSCKSPDNPNSTIPIVYICSADTEEKAREIHHKVWNQNTVPFLIIVSPDTVRVYNGFNFDAKKDRTLATIPLDKVKEKLSSLSRQSLDNAEIWESELWLEGPAKSGANRLDSRLLKNLSELGETLACEMVSKDKSKLSTEEYEVAHSLIVRYIYLLYMRHRSFLSDEWLELRKIKPDDVFSRNAKLEAFTKLNDILNEELNGSIFPLPKHKIKIKESHVKLVASVFYGDSVGGQQTLFELYDFSFIPTELLSTIYELFLHRKDKGKTEGAYYTPLPLVNFVLNELDEKKPLIEGMSVLDPSCGSGAFLVQAYRRLIRKMMYQKHRPLKPTELKNLLVKYFFGIDIDSDACHIAQLGLLLTLLDNLTPKELFQEGKFKLPCLKENIIESDTFDTTSADMVRLQDKKFDWIVGNPPWKKLSLAPEAMKWVKSDAGNRPVNDSLPEAFVWRSLDFARDDAAIGLLLPAMLLFNIKKAGGPFRKRFFSVCQVWAVANFANIRRMLFPGAIYPGAAFFFSPTQVCSNNEYILTYAPLRAEQPINRKNSPDGGAWNIVVNTSELRYISQAEAQCGDALVWKTAMWGSCRDLEIFRKTCRRFHSFESYAHRNDIKVYEGSQIRSKSENVRKYESTGRAEAIEFVPDLKGKNRLLMPVLRECGRIFLFPKEALEIIPDDLCYIRKRGGKLGLDVSKPPHILIDKARRFAIFSNQYIVVPPREVGIAGDNPQLLKALALYLNSDFFIYHQFFHAPEWGIKIDITVLDNLHCLPIPLDDITFKEQETWADLYDQLQENAKSAKADKMKRQDELLTEANKRINKALRLRPSEILLIQDFLTYRMKFVDGRVPDDLLQPCTAKELKLYAKRLQSELDTFFDEESEIHHEVFPCTTDSNVMAAVRIDVIKGGKKSNRGKESLHIPPAIFDSLKSQHSQWLYFRRNLRIYEEESIYIFKPKEKYHWIESQAILDSDSILADIISADGRKDEA